jgi:hypothetical protein
MYIQLVLMLQCIIEPVDIFRGFLDSTYVCTVLSFTSVDRLTSASVFRIATEFSLRMSVTCLDTEWVTSEFLSCNSPMVSCNRCESAIVAVPKSAQRTETLYLIKLRLGSFLGNSFLNWQRLDWRLFNNVSTCLNSDDGVRSCLCHKIRLKSDLIVDSISL